jgi:hypothetical protein
MTKDVPKGLVVNKQIWLEWVADGGWWKKEIKSSEFEDLQNCRSW